MISPEIEIVILNMHILMVQYFTFYSKDNSEKEQWSSVFSNGK